MGAIAVAIAQARINFVVLICVSLKTRRAIAPVGVNVHAEGANGNDIWQRAERLLLNLHLGRLVHLHRRVDLVRSHAPQCPGTCKFRSVDFELDTLLGVRRVEHCNGERLSIFTESRNYIERIGRTARIDCRLVAAGREGRLRLWRVARDLDGDGAEVIAVHLEKHTRGVEDRLGAVGTHR